MSNIKIINNLKDRFNNKFDMKQKKYILLILILLFIVVMFTDKPKNKIPVNSVSMVLSESKSDLKQVILKKIQKEEIPEKEIYDPIKGYDKTIDKTPEVDYVTAFREFKKFKRCRIVLESAEKGLDPYQDFINIKSKYKYKPFELTLIQQQSFWDYVQMCNVMLSHDGELYTAAAERFRKRFYQAQPKSKEAKDLAASWPLKVKTEHIGFKFSVFIEGYDSENSKQVLAVNKQLNKYKGMLRYIYRNDDIEFSPRTLDEIKMYEAQVLELESIVSGNLIVDDDYLVVLYQDFNNNITTINTFLAENQSGEAFLTLAPLMFSRKNIEFGFYDKRYFYDIINPTYILFGCSLGLPCGVDSKPMILACLFARDLDEMACNKTAEDYYLNFYFSPNQLIDIDFIISYFIDHYAK